jgi:hypothetical protein
VRPVRIGREIDREVRAVLQNALAVYEIELARLQAARPDVIVTQDLRDACAVSFADVCAAATARVDQPVRIVNLRPTRLDDVGPTSLASPMRWVDRRIEHGRSDAGAREPDLCPFCAGEEPRAPNVTHRPPNTTSTLTPRRTSSVAHLYDAGRTT